MDERDISLIKELRNRLPAEVTGHLRKIIIFGSRVRGEATEESDLDVIALVDKNTPEIEKTLEDAAYQIMWDYDFKPIISLKVFSESQFYNAIMKGFSFYQRVEKEGVAV